MQRDLLSEEWELSNVDYGELICTRFKTCSWRPGDFGLCQNICSRFTCHLQSSWLVAHLGSEVSPGVARFTRPWRLWRFVLFVCHWFGSVELQHGYFSSLTCTSMDETHEFSQIQGRTEFGVHRFFGTDSMFYPVWVKTGTVKVSKWWHISCWGVVRWLKVTRMLESVKMERERLPTPLH